MPTPAQIDEQVQLERDQIAQGLKRLRDNTRQLEEKSYASASIYGISSIDILLPLVVERIEETVHQRIKKGKNGRSFVEIQKYLADLEPLAAAAIACKLTFDKVFSYKDGSDVLTNVCDSIGHAVENECQMRHYESKAPGLLNVLKKNYWHRAIGTQQKIVVIQTLMNRYDVQQWQAWGRCNRIKLGAWLLDCIIDVSGWFTKDMRQEGRKRVNYVIPTPEFIKIKDQVMRDSELFAPLAWGMLIPPNDWSEYRSGGYLLNEVMHGNDMVRRGDQGCIQGETPYAFLNKIQKVGYRLNPFIVKVAKELDEVGIAIGKFVPIVEIPLPPKPVDIAENRESRKVYRRRAAEVHNKNAQSFKNSCRTRMTMEAVKKFEGRSFWIPWSFDYRGRAYPIPAFLTPQDTDFGKSLLRFDKEAFVTPDSESWLAFQVATTFGLDKATMSERLQWVEDNITVVKRIAEDPIGNIPEWEDVEEPWQFIAACDEYYHCCIACDRHYTGLMVAVDATASGLQILSGLSRDKSTAVLTNVFPSEKPQDAYLAVSELAKPNCPKHLQPYIDRKVSKRLVMTIPYSAKFKSNWTYVKEALVEKGLEPTKEDVTSVTHAMREAVYQIFPGPLQVMSWIEKEVSGILKTGKDRLQWVTPSGFIVNQKINKKLVTRLQLQLLGNCEVHVATEDTDTVDRNGHKNATSPNLIHSLDSSLLHLGVLRFDAPIALIHDSVLCRATDMGELSTIVRETYMHLFAEQDYLSNWASQIGAQTKPPIIGDLEPESVIESTYFFC